MLAETVTLHTPETTSYMVAAYCAIGVVLSLYTLSLLSRLRKAKEA